MSEPVAADGTAMAKLLGASAEAAVVVHGLPTMPKDTEIIGFCCVADKYARPGQYDWMVHDFLTWKSAFANISENQHWYSSTDIVTFEKKNDLPHTKAGSINYLLHNNVHFMENFLHHVKNRALAAEARKTTLFIMVFSPISNDLDICVDLEETERVFISTDMIRGAIECQQLPVILMTVSPFTGGWLCRPSVFPVPGSLTDKALVNVVAKSCGGVFADAHMDSFVKTSTTPLLTTEERAKMPYEDMMPVGPTAEMTARLHLFQAKIHEVVNQRFSPDAKKAGILYNSMADGGMELRPQISDTLSISLPVSKHSSEPAQDHDEDNYAGFDFLGHAFGGTKESQLFHLRFLVGIELQSCSGDWAVAATGITKQLFNDFTAAIDPEVDMVKRVFDALEFRGTSMAIAFMMAVAFSLPRPIHKPRFWEEEAQDDTIYAAIHAAHSVIYELFGQPAVVPGERRHDFNHVRFHRASRWLSTCVAIASVSGSIGDIKSFVRDQLKPLFDQIRQAQAKLLDENPAIDGAGTAWLTSLRLGSFERTTINLHERMKRKLSEMDAAERVVEELKHGVQDAVNSSKRAKADTGMKASRHMVDTQPAGASGASGASGTNPEEMLVTDWSLFEKKYSDHAAATAATTVTTTPHPTVDPGLDVNADVPADTSTQTYAPVRPELEHWKNFNDKPVVSVADYDDEMEAQKQAAGPARESAEAVISDEEADQDKNSVHDTVASIKTDEPIHETSAHDAGPSKNTDKVFHSQVKEVTASIRHLSIGPLKSFDISGRQFVVRGDQAAIKKFEEMLDVFSNNPRNIHKFAEWLKKSEGTETSTDKRQESETGEKMTGEDANDNEAHLTPPQTPIGNHTSATLQSGHPSTVSSGMDEDTATPDDGPRAESVGGHEDETNDDGVEGATSETAPADAGVRGPMPGEVRLAEAEDFWATVGW